MPDPSNYADESAFMADCVPMMVDEGKPQDQAVAACSSMWEDRGKAAPQEVRGWSTLTVKSFDAEQRIIEGWASKPEIDRIGDIVEPLGAKIKIPMPLLWAHRHDEPVGHVIDAKVTKEGISIRARIAKIAEPGPLKDSVDKAWQAVKAGLVQGLSIGFRPHEFEPIENGGLRFTKSEIFELSLVVIPALASATITLIKSLDADLLAASGRDEIGSATDGAKVVPSARPGASGTSVSLKRTGVRDMKTIGEQLEALTAKRVATEARMNAIMAKAMEEGRSTDEAEREEFDNLDAELATLDGDVKRFKSLERSNAATAKAVDAVKSPQDAADVRGGGYIKVTAPKLPPGLRFARVAKCMGQAGTDRGAAVQIAEQLYGDDQPIVNILKAAVSAGTTTDATWAGPLVSDEGAVFADFLDYLRPQTILGRFGNNGIPALRSVPFRVPLGGQSSGGAAYWTAEAQSKGLTRFDFTRTSLEPLKVANIAVVTEELLRSAAISAETLIRDQLAAAIRERLDIDFIDPAKAAVANVSPASVTNGVTAVASSGVTVAGVNADVQAIMQAFIDADNPPTSGVWIMGASTALSLGLMLSPLGQPAFPGVSMNGGTFAGLPVIVSEYVGTSGGSPNTKYVFLVNASQIYLGDEGGISVRVSRDASLVMDSAPTTMHAAEMGSPSAPLAAAMVSMYQTNSVAFLAERTVNWVKARPSAVQALSGVVWGT